ncbi:MAG: hypothetical protein CMJ27_04685 [Phycisphaerae bacterium]|nr:hypothetical protein [Phycisphaerae bacterium]OUX02282.1 MAG: hypothetical protein CBD91_02795 [Phycisphaeraceae bacterium TMED231]
MSIIETSITPPPVVGGQWTGPLPANPGAPPARGIDRTAGPPDQASFLRGMVRELGGDPDSAEASTREGIVAVAARRLVADAFVEPMLREAREAAQPTGIFAPGAGEKRFSHLVDRAMADRIVDGHRFGLVDALERSLQRQVTGLTEPASQSGLDPELFA